MTFKIFAILTLVTAITPFGTHAAVDKSSPHTSKHKIGVLLINHGSRSETWRNGLYGIYRTLDCYSAQGI